MPTADAFPAGAADGEVRLAGEDVLLLAPEAVAEVSVVNVPVVHAEAFLRVADGPGQKKRKGK